MSNNPGILTGGGLLPVNQTPQQLQANTQAMFAAQAQQAAFNQLARRQQRRWVIDGEPMTMAEFADTLWPDACAEKTFFYMKYKEDEQ